MADPIRLETAGQRVYFRGNTFAAKDRIKSMGGHWDGDSRSWWVGKKLLPKAEALVAELNGHSVEMAAAAGLRPDAPASLVADALEESGREADAQAVRAAAAAPPPAEDVSDCRVYAQVEYKGRRYYVVAETKDQIRCRLTTLDGMTPFWVDCQACNLIRTYEGREVWDGRRYSGKTRTEYPTIGSLRAFRDRQRDPATRRGCCTECGAWGPAGQSCSECGGEGSYA